MRGPTYEFLRRTVFVIKTKIIRSIQIELKGSLGLFLGDCT